MDDNTRSISQIGLLKEFFKLNPNKDITHREMRDWVNEEYQKRTGKRFEDPDRGVRSLSDEGFLIKVKKGVYRYDPNRVIKRDLSDFTPAQKEQIFRKDNYTCVMCGRSTNNFPGLELHADHIKSREHGGLAIIENGQTLCSRCNFIKKDFNQTTTGKKMFIHLYELAKASGETELVKFCEEILAVYEKNNMNGVIKWTR